jgi:hypothetical protein
MERRGPIEVTNIKGFLPTSLFLLQMNVTCFPSSEKGVFSKVCNRPLLYNLRVGVEQRWFCPLMVRKVCDKLGNNTEWENREPVFIFVLRLHQAAFGPG